MKTNLCAVLFLSLIDFLFWENQVIDLTEWTELRTKSYFYISQKVNHYLELV